MGEVSSHHLTMDATVAKLLSDAVHGAVVETPAWLSSFQSLLSVGFPDAIAPCFQEALDCGPQLPDFQSLDRRRSTDAEGLEAPFSRAVKMGCK